MFTRNVVAAMFHLVRSGIDTSSSVLLDLASEETLCCVSFDSAPLDESCFRDSLLLLATRRFREDSELLAAGFRKVILVTHVNSPLI